MQNTTHALKPILYALAGGGVFAAYSAAVGFGSAPKIMVGSVLFAVLLWVIRFRGQRGEPLLSRTAAIALSIGALGVYVWRFLVVARPSGLEWIAVLLGMAFPLLLLWLGTTGRLYNGNR